MRKPSLKITHIVDEYTTAGGLSTVIAQIAQHSVASGAEVEIICTKHDSLPVPEGVSLKMLRPSLAGAAWDWSPELTSVLRKSLTNGQQRIVHLHGVWKAPQWIAARIAKQLNMPFVLTDHGMLNPWLWNYKGKFQCWKKKVYWKFMAYPVFRHASVIHSITSREHQFLTELFPNQRIENIPNAIHLSETDNILNQIGEAGISRERIVLFVGRLDPQKGLDILIKAFARAALPRDWKLVIVGPNRVLGYLDLLKKMAANEKIADSVTFLGGVYGTEKWSLYRKAWIVAVPSHFEAVGLVNLEAAACMTPTITTYETGLSDWQTGGGLLISPDVEMLTAALQKVCAWSNQERQERGKASLDLVRRKYNWDVVVEQWLKLYHSMVS
jgi:glycosyltransferase involved in cell wall biosynthesis